MQRSKLKSFNAEGMPRRWPMRVGDNEKTSQRVGKLWLRAKSILRAIGALSYSDPSSLGNYR